MITITKKEEIILNQIKIFNYEYSEGVPENLIKMELGIYEHELKEILNELNSKNIISYENNKVQLTNNEHEIKSVNSKKEVIEAELDKKEQESLKIIKELVNKEKTVSRYTLEGNLLYGHLKLSDFRMYHIILSLENKGIIKKIKKNDGEYYLLIESE